MAILPVQGSRTSTALSTERSLAQLNSDQIALQEQYEKLSTGRNLLRMSDDPAAAGRAISLQRGIARSEQLVRNANATEAFYQSTDSALNRVDASLIEARGVAVSAAQNVLSDPEREALAATIDQILTSVVGGGNAMFRDHQLLGGILEPGNAFQWDGNDIVFQGNTAIGKTHLGSGDPAAVNINGTQALGALGEVVSGESLSPALNSNTRLVDMRGGKGVEPGVFRISDGTAWQEVDLSNAATLQDVIDKIESLNFDGRTLSVTVGPDSVQVGYTNGAPGTLATEDLPGSELLKDLGLENPSGLTAPPLTGTGQSPRITSETLISDLANGAGVDLSAGILIQQGDEQFPIDLSGAETLGDVTIAINRSDADVHAELDQEGQRIVLRALRSGVDYSIGENGGTTATALGIRSATTETRLSELGKGVGIAFNPNGPDLEIIRPNGVVLDLELSDADSIQDVIDLIENHPLNQDTQRVLVSLNGFGNGIELSAPPGAAAMRIRQPGVSDAGLRLGLIPLGEAEAVGAVVGSVMQITGSDYAAKEAGGAIDTLIRLKTAVREGDLPTIERLQASVDLDLNRSSQTRGRVGAWTQNLQELRDAVESESILLQSQLSNEMDADLAAVISELTLRQTSMEASLRVIGQTATQTVLNYI